MLNEKEILKQLETLECTLIKLQQELLDPEEDDINFDESLAMPCRCGGSRKDLELEKVDVKYLDGEVERNYRIKCKKCNRIGPESPTLSGAILGWNEYVIEERGRANDL